MVWYEEVRKWLKENKVSLNDLSKLIEVPRSTLGDQLRGKTLTLVEDRRKKLYDITGLEILSKPIEPIEPSFERPQLEESELVGALKDISSIVSGLREKIEEKDRPIPRSVANRRIGEIRNLFYDLIEKMDYLKEATPQEREMFRKVINSRDVGYMMSFLNAIYKEDKFQSWVLMSNYRPRR